MPRRNRRPSRRPHVPLEPEEQPDLTPGQLAADLVRRGLASEFVLDRYVTTRIGKRATEGAPE